MKKINKSNKKILYVVTKGEAGGAQRFIYDCVSELKDTCTIECSVGREGVWLPDRLKKIDILVHNLLELTRSMNPISFIKAFFEWRIFIKKNSYTTIHLNSTHTLQYALYTKLLSPHTKLIFTHHGLSYLENGVNGKYIEKLLTWCTLAFFGSFIDVHVAVCTSSKQRLQKLFFWFKNIIVIYNGVSSIPADQYLKKEDEPLLKNNFVLLTIGRLAYPKNQEFIIKNFHKIIEKIPNACYVLIGEGPDKERLTVLVKNENLEDKVLFLGEKAEARKYLKYADIFVLPSVFEGFPYVILEALSAGIPTIAAKVGGIAEVMQQEKLFKHTTESLLEALEKTMNKTPQQLSEEFTVKKMVEKYKKQYDQ